ncbi:MAG: hypothetical protein JWO38_5213, partial [Gemmataceae bacterium]|nr:hypothetical protein [Gemmataceae bacterium]
SPCAVRVVEVPPAVHARYRHAKALPLYQMIAKNVGIRRARGEFVLATNVDLLFSDDLVRFIAARNLRPDRMYRTDRHDVPADVPPDAPLDDQLAYCRDHRLRVNARNRIIFFGPKPVGAAASSRDLVGEQYAAWRTAPLKKKLKAAATWPVFVPLFIGHRLFGGWFGRRFLGYPDLHTNGCGDFTLMARDVWFGLRGYAELDVFSMHLDSLLLHCAYNHGLWETILPDQMRVYHIEHGAGWTPEGEAKLDARLAAAGIEQLTVEQYNKWVRRMYRDKRAMMFNTEGWGLTEDHLPESCISPAEIVFTR